MRQDRLAILNEGLADLGNPIACRQGYTSETLSSFQHLGDAGSKVR